MGSKCYQYVMCLYFNGAVAPMKVKMNSFKINQSLNFLNHHFLLCLRHINGDP